MQTADHHAIRLRNAATGRHRLLGNHPRNKRGRCDSRNEPRRQQPRGYADLRVDPACRVSATFNTEPGRQADKNAGTRHFPLQLIETWD